MFVKTMAVKITEETYPLAVACLSSEFLRIVPSETYNCYLVINRVDVNAPDENGHKNVTLVNSWYAQEIFDEHFQFVDQRNTGKTFAEVTRR